MGRKAVSKDSKGVTQLGGTGTAFNLNMPQAGGALEFKASLSTESSRTASEILSWKKIKNTWGNSTQVK